jgi:hypothetical protein
MSGLVVFSFWGYCRLRDKSWSDLGLFVAAAGWEAIEHLKAPNGSKVYSLRLNPRIRDGGFRDGDFLRLISRHPDHDSAYEP